MSPQDTTSTSLGTLPEKVKEEDQDSDPSNSEEKPSTAVGKEEPASPPRQRVKMLSRERRSLSRHSSGNIGPGMLSRERNMLGPSRAQSMRVIRPLNSSHNHNPTEDGPGGTTSLLSREKLSLPTSRRGQMPGSMRSSRSGAMRGISRAKSMADGPLTRSLARSRSSREEPSQRLVGRTNSQRSLAHMASEASLRPYRGHDKVVNQSIASARPTLRRSADDRSHSDLSLFTLATSAESAKCADPLLDDQATYRETDSIADHDTCVSDDNFNNGEQYTEFLPDNDPNRIPYDGASLADGTLCTFDSVQLRRRQIMANNSNHSFDASSFSTFNSGDLNMEGAEFEGYVGETGYLDDFYLDETHVVEEEDAEGADDSSDEETIEGDVSDNEEPEEEDDDDEEEDD